ncbi:NAD(P)/FAD-dependent oxidoreductase [Microcella sp.]|uniref:NAD(P)/FAD-dependent oxidoreductase n=1 Tax=Microcella sp. TaxID=1913979 RepID=UPI00256E6771|nr:FAD-dependent monooxygenase [Microcella sp.]MBX9472085.1 FAD-dependent monooxygenase [Microcella sp.]
MTASSTGGRRLDADVLIGGGGPIGLATALELHARGLTAIVLEPREGTIDKACGEGLMPGALAALGRLGVDPAGHPLRGIRYQDARRSVTHRYRSAAGRGVRRTVLHDALRARAAEVGIETRHERVDRITQSDIDVTANGLRARWLIGADGLHSTVREVAALDRPARESTRGARRYGLRQHFAVAPWSDLVEVTYLPDAELYITPVDERTVGVAVLAPRPLDLEMAIAQTRELKERLEGADEASALRGAGALRQRTRARTAGRVALVGDASGYVDALTGEGLRVGLAQSEVLADCLAAGSLAGYERAWARSTRDFRVLTAGLLAAATSPARGLIVPAAAALPRVFGAVVERLAR